MGFLNELGSLASQASGGGQQSQVAGGFLQALEQYPGGVGSLLGALRQNGLGEHVDAWTQGQQKPVEPQQVQQALGGTGLIDRTAQNAGVSHEVVTAALTTLLPMILRHLAPGGQPTQQAQSGGFAQQILGKLL